MDRLGELLRDIRRQRGLSQERLAAAAQVTSRTLRYWEANSQQPREVELESVLKVLNATRSERAQIYSMLTAPRGVRLARTEDASGSDPEQAYGTLPGIGDLMRAMRQRQRLTQEQLAARMSVSRATIMRWEATQTLPIFEDIDRLCDAMDALPEERTVLLSKLLLPANWKPQLSLEECTEQFELLNQVHAERIDLMPLVDLYSLALKRQVRGLLHQSHEAVRLLAKVEALHCWWLHMWGRSVEAKSGSYKALHMVDGKFAPEEFWHSALSVISFQAAHGPGGGESAVKILDQWVRRLPPYLQVLVLCDMALYAGWAGEFERAEFHFKAARRALWLDNKMDCEDNWYYRTAQARVLSSAGQGVEAIEWLPQPQHAGGGRIFENLMWAEALISAGERDMASQYLADTQSRLAEAPMMVRQRKLDQLARQL